MKKLFLFFISLYTLYFILYTGTASANDMGQTKYQDASVTATIPSRISDFQFSFTSVYPPTIQHDTQQLYQITYGAYKSAGLTTTPTITLNWSNAVDPNDAQVFTYMPGSATNGYGGAIPVVDLIDHTITWSITSFPYGLWDQRLYAEFQTTGNYVLFTPFNFTMNATMHNEYVTMPQQILKQTYYYNLPPGIPGPTATPTPAPAPTATPTPPPPPPPLSNVEFTGISDSNSTIAIQTLTPSRLIVYYGTTRNKLSQSVSTKKFSIESNVSLTNLKPNSTYYFRIKTIDKYSRYYISELFTFKTAKETFSHKLGNNIIVITTKDNVLLSNSQKQVTYVPPELILTPHNTYEISYRLGEDFSLRSIDAVVRNKVLAANTFSQMTPQPDLSIPMQQLKPSFYIADLHTLTPGTYAIFVRIADTFGNIVEQKIADLKVIPFLSVYKANTDTPISDARVDFSYYDMKSHRYKPLTPALFGSITNPDYTNILGEIPTTLPLGNYRIKVSALGYDTKTIDFIIGPAIGQQFPVVYLQYDPFNLLSFIANISYFVTYIFTTSVNALHVIAASSRSFDILSAIITGSSVILAFLLFMLKSRIALRYLLHFLLFNWHQLLQKHKQKYFFGGVTGTNNEPLSRVQIDVEDSRTGTILTQTSTNASGRFYVRNQYEHDINLVFIKPGYTPTTIHAKKNMDIPDTGLSIILTKGESFTISLISKLIIALEYVFGLLFETSLIISFVLELLFFSVFGFIATLPFVILSLLNVILWILYLRERTIN